ncbi:hypothetical protein [Streptomyces spongiicola]|uniref:hypothetical protein n=1 Tax=Streptomyces spongiicola TaxID=1690221 RepID=UPI0013A53903|nr:hypothetical protein [Streptomyces spongiicola]
MRNTTRRGFVGILAAAMGAMTLAGLPGQAVAAESQIPSTPEAYVAWLEAKSEPGAAETIAQFKELPAEKQKKFIGYLNAPDHFEAFMDAVESPAAKRSVLADGDIVIDREEEGGVVSARGTAGDKSVWHSVSDTIFGVKVTTVKLGVNYRTTATRTTKVYGGWASHTNWVPALKFEHSPIRNWISADPGNNAHSETVWKGEFAVYGVWSCRHRVWADQDGFKGGYLKRV